MKKKLNKLSTNSPLCEGFHVHWRPIGSRGLTFIIMEGYIYDIFNISVLLIFYTENKIKIKTNKNKNKQKQNITKQNEQNKNKTNKNTKKNTKKNKDYKC